MELSRKNSVFAKLRSPEKSMTNLEGHLSRVVIHIVHPNIVPFQYLFPYFPPLVFSTKYQIDTQPRNFRSYTQWQPCYQ